MLKIKVVCTLLTVILLWTILLYWKPSQVSTGTTPEFISHRLVTSWTRSIRRVVESGQKMREKMWGEIGAKRTSNRSSHCLVYRALYVKQFLFISTVRSLYCTIVLPRKIHLKYLQWNKLDSNFIQLVPYFIITRLISIPGLTGLCIAGIFSGSLSTMSSALNSMSTVAVIDFLKPSLKTTMKDTTLVFVAKGLCKCRILVLK